MRGSNPPKNIRNAIITVITFSGGSFVVALGCSSVNTRRYGVSRSTFPRNVTVPFFRGSAYRRRYVKTFRKPITTDDVDLLLRAAVDADVPIRLRLWSCEVAPPCCCSVSISQIRRTRVTQTRSDYRRCGVVFGRVDRFRTSTLTCLHIYAVSTVRCTPTCNASLNWYTISFISDDEAFDIFFKKTHNKYYG